MQRHRAHYYRRKDHVVALPPRQFCLYDEEVLAGTLPAEKVAGIEGSYFACASTFPSNTHIVRFRRADFFVHNPFYDEEDSVRLDMMTSLTWTIQRLNGGGDMNAPCTWHASYIYTLFQVLSYLNLKELYLSMYAQLRDHCGASSAAPDLRRCYAIVYLLTDDWILSEYKDICRREEMLTHFQTILHKAVFYRILERRYFDKCLDYYLFKEVFLDRLSHGFVEKSLREPHLPRFHTQYTRFYNDMIAFMHPHEGTIKGVRVTHLPALLAWNVWVLLDKQRKKTAAAVDEYTLNLIFIDTLTLPTRLIVLRCHIHKCFLRVRERHCVLHSDDSTSSLENDDDDDKAYEIPLNFESMVDNLLEKIRFKCDIRRSTLEYAINYDGLAQSDDLGLAPCLSFYQRYTSL
jgi:hypothetical protein